MFWNVLVVPSDGGVFTRRHTDEGAFCTGFTVFSASLQGSPGGGQEQLKNGKCLCDNEFPVLLCDIGFRLSSHVFDFRLKLLFAQCL